MMKAELKIHSENILPIIKQWLYSDKDIFIRELVSNATDAIQKLVLLEKGEPPFRIDVKVDKEAKTITVSDNGIGMTLEEVETYICQIAFSGAEEFVQKYAHNKDQFIGHFGLGFYSAFMVSSSIEIETKSYLEDQSPAHWTSDGSSTYDLEVGTKTTRGTDIILHVEDEDYLDQEKIREILTTYCGFLQYPIYLNGDEINSKPPLWLKKPSDCEEAEYLDFYKTLYPLEPDPIFWVHLQIDHPFHLKAILYFPKITPRFDFQSSNIKLFCNRVFVTDNCKDLFPSYLNVLRGAIDSIDIPLNVSRSYLQKDAHVKKLASHISKKIADRLSDLYAEEKEKFISYWPDVETIVKFGMLQDEKFYDRSKNFLLWKTLDQNFLTIEEYLASGREKVYYTPEDSKDGSFLTLYKEKNIPVITTKGPIDTALFNFLEQKLSIKFHRVDSNVDEALIDESGEKHEGDFTSLLGLPNVTVETKSLANKSLPAFIVIEEGTRRLRDYLSMTQKEMPQIPLGGQTFVMNTNSPLVSAIFKLKEKDEALAGKLTKQLYDLSLLSQKELHPENLTGFIQKTTEVLEALALKLS
ncbi:MAG: molecular chaperone HtpG [Chlamydiae bacterium]|nr:molecular chaperone HtpG [Chlamydiota bacterium]